MSPIQKISLDQFLGLDFSYSKTTLAFFYGAELIFRSFATFFGETIFDQVTNKGFALLAAGQFATRLQEFGLWGS